MQRDPQTPNRRCSSSRCLGPWLGSWERGRGWCYRLSKRPNCFRGTCSGLGTWWPRCTKGASSGTRHVVPLSPPPLTAPVTAPLSGAASPMTPALSTTRASVRVPAPFPQLSPHIPSYRPTIPNPCALGQQVTVVLSCLLSYPASCTSTPDHS